MYAKNVLRMTYQINQVTERKGGEGCGYDEFFFYTSRFVSGRWIMPYSCHLLEPSWCVSCVTHGEQTMHIFTLHYKFDK